MTTKRKTFKSKHKKDIPSEKKEYLPEGSWAVILYSRTLKKYSIHKIYKTVEDAEKVADEIPFSAIAPIYSAGSKLFKYVKIITNKYFKNTTYYATIRSIKNPSFRSIALWETEKEARTFVKSSENMNEIEQYTYIGIVET